MKIVVRAGVDPLRVRREARDLLTTLTEDPELQRLGLVVGLPPNPEPDDGGKGLGDEIGTLVASGAGVAAARYLLSALRLWLSRPDRRTTIDLHEADRSVTLTGDPSEDQQQLVREFLDARRGDPR